MHSDMIGKIEKARRYAMEPERFRFDALRVTVRGNNGGDHEVVLDGDRWQCACEFFAGHGACAHTIALELVLEGMLPAGVTPVAPVAPVAAIAS